MKKSKLIILQLFIASVLICTSVYAAVSTTIGLSVSNTSVKRGDKVTVTLSLKDVDSSKKVTSIDGYINYNTNIFETINVDSIQKDSDGTVQIGHEKLKVEDVTNATVEDLPSSSAYIAFNGAPLSDENNTRIVIDFSSGINANTDLLKIDFKVKSDASIGEIKNAITYSNFHITAGSEVVQVTENISLNIQQSGNTQNPDPDENKNENKNENINENNNQNENKNEDKNENKNDSKNENKNTNQNINKNTNKNINNTTNISNRNINDNRASGILPATGAKVIILPAIALIILACVCYNKYIKYKDI